MAKEATCDKCGSIHPLFGTAEQPLVMCPRCGIQKARVKYGEELKDSLDEMGKFGDIFKGMMGL